MTPPFYLRVLATVLALSLLCSCRRESAATPADLAKAQAAHLRDHQKVRDWYERRYLESYLRARQHDPRWDDAITNTLKLVASVRAGESASAEDKERIANSAGSALASGCKDPLVRYLKIRYGTDETADSTELGNQLREIALDMVNEGYPDDIAFYPCVRAARALKGNQAQVSQETYQMRVDALTHATEVLKNKSVPAVEVRLESLEVLKLLKPNPQLYAHAWKQIEPLLFQNWVQYAFPHSIKAEYHYDEAWTARGGGFADSVTSKGWKTFERELKVAQSSFEEAWKIDNTDPATARWMIEICVSRSLPREQMEVWFKRAMAANPNYFPACRTKLRYLEPKWGGSPEAMLAFGRECLTNAADGGEVTTTLVEAYNILAGYLREDPAKLAEFYASPQLWRDVSEVYAEVARRDPDASWYHNNLAWYAWRCGKWEVLAEEVAKIQKPNYRYFGGDSGYKRMLDDLKTHTQH